MGSRPVAALKRHEVARAHAQLVRKSLDRHVAFEVALHVLFRLLHPVVAVRAREYCHRVTGLAVARHADEKRLRTLEGDFVAAEFLDHVQAQIDGSVDATAAEHATILGNELLGAPADAGIALAQRFRNGPVRSGLASVEQPALGEKHHTAAHAREVGATVVHLL